MTTGVMCGLAACFLSLVAAGTFLIRTRDLVVPPRRHLYVPCPRFWSITASNVKLRMGGLCLVEEVDVGVSCYVRFIPAY